MSAGGTSVSMRRFSMSIVTTSPSQSAASGPPSAASGAMWPTISPRVPPEKRPSVSNATVSPSPAPTIALVMPSISRIPGPPRGPSYLDDRTVGREIAAQNHEPTRRFERTVRRGDHDLSRRLDDLGNFFPERTAGNRHRGSVHELRVDHALGDQLDAAGVIDVKRHVFPAGAKIGDDRRTFADRIEIVDLERDARFARDCEQMQHAIGGTAGTGRGCDRVLERIAREQIAWAHAAPQEIHHDLARFVPLLRFARIGCARRGAADGREADEFHDHGHRVRGKLTAARTGTGNGVVFDREQFRVADLPGRVRPDRFVDVDDREIFAVEFTWRDRAPVEDQRGNVEPHERHRRAGRRFIAGAERYDRIEHVAAPDEFDRIGDHFARDERGLHALRTHRNTVGDGDRVEFHRRAACFADAALHVFGERAQVEIARHRFDPRVRDADDGFGEVLVAEPHGFEHGSRAGAVAPVRDNRAARFYVVAHALKPGLNDDRNIPAGFDLQAPKPSHDKRVAHAFEVDKTEIE